MVAQMGDDLACHRIPQMAYSRNSNQFYLFPACRHVCGQVRMLTIAPSIEMFITSLAGSVGTVLAPDRLGGSLSPYSVSAPLPGCFGSDPYKNVVYNS